MLKNENKAMRHHYHGRAHMICFWLLTMELPLTFLEMNLKNVWTTGLAILTFATSFVFSIVAIVKQYNSDMPWRIKCLPIMVPGGFVLLLLGTFLYGIALGIIEIVFDTKFPPASASAKPSIVDVAPPAIFFCIGVVGLVQMIRLQTASARPPSTISGRDN